MRNPEVISKISSMSVGKLIEKCLEQVDQIAELEATIAKLKEGVEKAAETLNDMLHQPVSDFSDIDDVIFDLEGIAGTQPTLVLEKTDG